ncbi:MAG TPA: nuclear transport factor 2 family protein [Gammaproteobacteria bacterium]
MASNDFHSVAEVLHPDFALDWPQSGERILGAFNFGEMNANYPAKGRWRFSVERLVADDNGAVTDTAITDGDIEARAITFFTVRDGKIRRVVEYWPEPFEPREDRAQWVERRKA